MMSRVNMLPEDAFEAWFGNRPLGAAFSGLILKLVRYTQYAKIDPPRTRAPPPRAKNTAAHKTTQMKRSQVTY